MESLEENREAAEVIVIGGGAAGCSAAINLARRGRKVVLLEGRSDRPPQLSDIHSGEVLSPGAQLELDRLGLSLKQDQAGDYLHRWKLQEWNTLRQRWPGGRETTDRLPGGLVFWQINRGNFYRALRQLARSEGVEVREGHRVINLLRDNDDRVRGVIARQTGEFPYQLSAPVTLDASGRNSVVLARLGLRQPEPHFRRAAYLLFFSELAGAPPPGTWQQYWLRRTTTLRGSYLAPNLYRFSFETSLAERARWQEKFGRLPAHELFLKVLDEQLPHLAGNFREAARLPHLVAFAPVGYRVEQITHDGLLMAGDASGYLDPLTGQGIEFALRLGRLAARSLEEAFAANRFDRTAFDRYLRDRQAEIQPIMRRLRFFLGASQYSTLLDLLGAVAPARRLATRLIINSSPTLAD